MERGATDFGARRTELVAAGLCRGLSVRNKVGRTGLAGHSATGDSFHCPLGPRISVRLICRARQGGQSRADPGRPRHLGSRPCATTLSLVEGRPASPGVQTHATPDATKVGSPVQWRGFQVAPIVSPTSVSRRRDMGVRFSWFGVNCPGDGTQILTGTWVTSSVLRTDLGTLRMHE